MYVKKEEPLKALRDKVNIYTILKMTPESLYTEDLLLAISECCDNQFLSLQLLTASGYLKDVTKYSWYKSFVKKVLMKRPSNIELIPDEHKDYEMCLHAVKDSGDNIRYVPIKHRTEELCEIALATSLEAIYYLPKDLI
jgi:hypothetical protein